MKKEYFTPDLELVKFDFPTELMASGGGDRDPNEIPTLGDDDLDNVG